MRHVFKHVRFDERASIYLHIPALRGIESTVPLTLDYFHFEDLSLCIDSVCFDFYEFWNFPVPSPPSKKEVERIYNQKHFGNLFFRKIDLFGRWEKKVSLELTQGEAEQKLINFLIGRFEKVRIRRLKIDDVENFLKRIGTRNIEVEKLHLKIQNFSGFLKICNFLNPESFPLKKLELETENLGELELEKLMGVENLRIKFQESTSEIELLDFLEKFLKFSKPNLCSKLTLEVPNDSFLHSIFDFFQRNFQTSVILGSTTQITVDQKINLKIFGGEVETLKNHMYDVCEKWKMWIFEMDVLKNERK